MRKSLLIVLALLLIIFYGCKKDEGSPSQVTPEPTELEGSWVGTELGGNSGWVIVFSGNSMESQSPSGGEWYKGTFTSNTGTSPRQFDLTVTQSSAAQYVGKVSLSIYKIESGVLTFASNAPGNTARPTSFSDPSARVFTSIGPGTPAPSVPVLLFPSQSATGVAIPATLSWIAQKGVMSYRLQVSTNSSFTKLVFDDSTLTGISKDVTGLSNNTTYYWRVNAKNSNGTSLYSSVYGFATTSGGTSGIPCPGVPTVTYSGKIYNTVQIGSQCWLKENLDVGTMITFNTIADSMRNNGVIEKFCYDNNPLYCAIYGGLYQWNEAMQYVRTFGARGICPAGWHIPTEEELQLLSTSVNHNSNALKAAGQGTEYGIGMNTSGFSALLAGNNNGARFGALNGEACFLSSTEYDTDDVYQLSLSCDTGGIYIGANYKSYGRSVRCAKDN